MRVCALSKDCGVTPMIVNGRPVTSDVSPDDRRIAGKPAEPVFVGQDDHRRIAARASLIGLNQTANGRLYTEQREVVVGDASTS